nr:cilia- and flagella-associated protein 61-like [Onthophagus taurus]
MSFERVANSPCTDLYCQRRNIDSIRSTRIAHHSDLPKLRDLVQVETTMMFGQIDIDRIFNLSMIGIICTTSSENIIGCVFFAPFPNIPSIPSNAWESWIHNKYNLESANSQSTQFIQIVLYHQQYKKIFLKPILTKIFGMYPELSLIVLVVPPRIKLIDWTCDLSTTIQSDEEVQGQTLQVFLRQNFVDLFRIRMGVMEDNDDLVPIVDLCNTRLKRIYGEYYIAEIISEDKNREVIVAEYNQETIGLVIFNSNLDYDILNKNFQLECFYGLKKIGGKDFRKKSIVIDDLFSRIFSEDLDHIIDLSKVESFSFISKKNDDVATPNDLDSKNLNDYVNQIPISQNSSYSYYLKKSTTKNLNKIRSEFQFSSHMLTFKNNDESELKSEKYRETFIKRRSIISNKPEENQLNQLYVGNKNAFVLEIIASKPNKEDCFLSLLNAGFDLYPDKDFCVLSLPQNAPIFPLITQCMVRVSPLATSNFPHELYVTHKSAISGRIIIETPKESDLNEIRLFLSGVTQKKEILKDFLIAFYAKNNNVQPFVIKSDKNLIGLVVLQDMINLEYVISRYQVSKVTDLSVHKPGSFGQIVYFVLSPIFQKHAKFLLMELHRLSDYTLLFYLLYPDVKDRNVYSRTALACVLGDLIPVLPAKMPEYDNLKEESVFMKIPDQQLTEKPFAVYVSTPIYCGLRRTEINSQIVVIGASDAGLSFLTNLIFHNTKNTHTTFTNITLVSTHGLPSHKPNKIKDMMIPNTSEIGSSRYLSTISLPTYVNVIEGVMSMIDRANKAILVNSTWLHYDVLILTCGSQFQIPTIKDLKDEDKIKGFGENINDIYVECPDNVFVINTLTDVDMAIESLKELGKILKNEEHENLGHIIVYGNSIEAYSCLETLLELNLSRLIFVEPHNEGFFNAFEDEEISKTIKFRLRRDGVKILENFHFYTWSYDYEETRKNNVIEIRFKSEKRFISIPCLAAFLYGEKAISRVTLNAINRANLIYDGHLVIDEDFKTNDPNIYAIGRITKYPRRFYADHMRHKHFNQVEIGKKLSQVVLKRLINPRLNRNFNQDDKDEDKKRLVPRYFEPIYIYAKLPRKLEYFLITKPGLTTPLDLIENDDDHKTISTGKARFLTDKCYFKIRIDRYNTIEMLQVLSKKKIDTTNLYHLWGKHESLLNNLILRYDMGLIEDLFDYFTQPSIYALYHDRYAILNQELNEILTSLSDTPGTSVIEDVIEKIEKNHYQKITNDQFNKMMVKLKDSDYFKEMENKVIEFLSKNMNYLPMYLTPAMINIILGPYEESPLFKIM